jgi:lysozyme
VRNSYSRKYSKWYHKWLNWIFHWRLWYLLVFSGIIVMYPIFVSDGQGWKFVDTYEISLPLKHQIHGIDVSHHNGLIDWAKVKKTQKNNAYIKFAFIKATEGTDLQDRYFDMNWKQAKKHGFIRGAYHFFVPYSDPKLQALNFILKAKHEEGDLIPVLDFEINGKTKKERENMVENVRIWLNTIESHYGIKPIIYTNRFIYNQYIKDNFKDYPLWISQYDSGDLEGYDDGEIVLWQHSCTGKLDGINGHVDFNVFLGSDFKLDKLRF